MSKFLSWSALTVVAAGLVGLLARAEEPGAFANRLRVVIIDGQNNHNWKATTPLIRKVLTDSKRFTVVVSTTPQADGKPVAAENGVTFPPNLDHYDVVLSNYNGADWPVPFQKSLEEHVKLGKLGLVIVHAADNSFPGWKEYNRMIGLGWRDAGFGYRLVVDANGKENRVPAGKGPGAGHGPQHPFTITVIDEDHPITRGMPHEWLHAQDELYHGLRGPAEDVRVLATAFSDKAKGGTGEPEPMIMTIAYEKGRVFHTPMGHDVGAMRCVGFITTLRRGTEWAATGKVTIPLPKNFPTAKEVSTIPEK
jgi:hypothetical protein